MTRGKGHWAQARHQVGRGKRRLLGSILPLIPDDIGTYCEPFVGGGAVWLALQPEKAVVNDMNTDLIDLYWTMADGTRLEAMLDLLRVWPDEKDFSCPSGRGTGTRPISRTTTPSSGPRGWCI